MDDKDEDLNSKLRSLVHDAINGNEAAFTEVYRYLQPCIKSQIDRWVFSRDDRSGLCQDIWIQILCQWKQGSKPPSFPRAWVRTVAFNACIDYLRKKERDRRRQVPWEDSDMTLALAAESCVGANMKQQMKGIILTRLTPIEVSVLIHRFWGKSRYSEIAVELGLTRDQVKHALQRALKKFAEFSK